MVIDVVEQNLVVVVVVVVLVVALPPIDTYATELNADEPAELYAATR